MNEWFFKWVKLLIENKWLVLWVSTLMFSAGGGSGYYFGGDSAQPAAVKKAQLEKHSHPDIMRKHIDELH